MPARPPKAWMRRCVEGVEESGSAVDPGAVCGAQWHHKLSAAQKRAALQQEQKRGHNPGMARKAHRAPAHLVPYQFRPAAPQAIVVRTRTVHAKPKKHHRGRAGASHGPITPQRLMGLVMGGFVAGFAEKQFGAQLPSVPLLGKKGTLTIALYFISKNVRSGILKDATIAAAAISGYELGLTGKISGEDVLGGVAAQV